MAGAGPGKRRRRVSIETSTCFRPACARLGAAPGANLSPLASSRRPLRERWVLYTIIMAAAGAPDGECGAGGGSWARTEVAGAPGGECGLTRREERGPIAEIRRRLGRVQFEAQPAPSAHPVIPFAGMEESGMDTEAETVATEAPARPLNCVEAEAAAGAAAEDSCDARGSQQPAPAQPPGDPAAQASVSNGEDAGGGAGRELELVDLKIIWNKTKHDVKVPLDSTGSELKQKIHSITGNLGADSQSPPPPPPSSS